MAENLVDIHEPEDSGDKPLFAVHVQGLIIARGDQAVWSGPIHEAVLVHARMQREGYALQLITKWPVSLKKYRIQRMSVSEIERERGRLRDMFTFFDGHEKVELFDEIYGPPGACRFVESMTRICTIWNEWMGKPEPFTDEQLETLVRSLLPSVQRVDTIDFIEAVEPEEATEGEPANKDEASAPATKATKHKGPKKQATTGKRAAEREPAGDPDQAADPGSIDAELVEYLSKSYGNEETVLELARLVAKHERLDLPAEALATVKAIADSPTKQERALEVLAGFKAGQAAAAG